jgi:hypothetical protein
MYAHDVIQGIDSLIRQIGSFKNQVASLLFKDIHNIRKMILSAQKFHGGDENILAKQINQYGNKCFCGFLADGVRLPYPVCWFDFNVNEGLVHGNHYNLSATEKSKKRGVLAIEIDVNTFVCRVFFHCNQSGWQFSPLRHIITMNGDFNIEVAPWWPHKNDIDKIKQQSYEDADEITALNHVLLLLGCKNIVTEKVFPDEKINTRRKKKGKTPIQCYRVLRVAPATSRQKSIPKNLWENAIHLTRGHFKTYTKDSPLFGSIVGRYWWQPSVRGSKKNGIVIKDYDCSQLAFKQTEKGE